MLSEYSTLYSKHFGTIGSNKIFEAHMITIRNMVSNVAVEEAADNHMDPIKMMRRM